MNQLTNNKIIIINGLDIDDCTELAYRIGIKYSINVINPHFLLNETYKLIEEAHNNPENKSKVLLMATYLYNELFNIPYIICSKNLFSSCISNPILWNINPKYALHTNINKFIRNWQRRLIMEGLKTYENQPLIVICPYEYSEIENLSSDMLYIWVSNRKDGELLDNKSDKLKQSLLKFRMNSQYTHNKSNVETIRRVEEFINEYQRKDNESYEKS